jgi:tetratricopeptide (TPR) repeat protein
MLPLAPMKPPCWTWLSLCVAFGLLTAKASDQNALSERVNRLEDTDQYNAALSLLLAAEKANPGDPFLLARISEVYGELSDQGSDEGAKKKSAQTSVDYAKQAVTKGPNLGEAHLAMAIAIGKMTDFVDNRTKMEYSRTIKSEAEKAVQLDPSLDQAYLILARWNFEMTQLNPVLKAIAQMMYGQIPAASQSQAIVYFQKAIAAKPDRIETHYEYGDALRRMGKKDESRAQFEKVLQLPALGSDDRRTQREARKQLK